MHTVDKNQIFLCQFSSRCWSLSFSSASVVNKLGCGLWSSPNSIHRNPSSCWQGRWLCFSWAMAHARASRFYRPCPSSVLGYGWGVCRRELEGVSQRGWESICFLRRLSVFFKRVLEGKKASKNLRKPSKNPFSFFLKRFWNPPPFHAYPLCTSSSSQAHQKPVRMKPPTSSEALESDGTIPQIPLNPLEFP